MLALLTFHQQEPCHRLSKLRSKQGPATSDCAKLCALPIRLATSNSHVRDLQRLVAAHFTAINPTPFLALSHAFLSFCSSTSVHCTLNSCRIGCPHTRHDLARCAWFGWPRSLSCVFLITSAQRCGILGNVKTTILYFRRKKQ